jgi:hypothetical protein
VRTPIERLLDPLVVKAIQGELAGDGNIWGRMQSSVDGSSGVPEWFTAVVDRLREQGVTPEDAPEAIKDLLRSREM